MGPGEGHANASKQTSFPSPPPPREQSCLYGHWQPGWESRCGRAASGKTRREPRRSPPRPPRRPAAPLGGRAVPAQPPRTSRSLPGPCDSPRPTSLMSSCDPSWLDMTARSGSNEERQCRLSSRSKTWGCCCPAPSGRDWEMLLGRQEQSSLPAPHHCGRKAGIYRQPAGTFLVVERWTQKKASMNLHPEILQSHLQEHAAKVLLRAARLSHLQTPVVRGPLLRQFATLEG